MKTRAYLFQIALEGKGPPSEFKILPIGKFTAHQDGELLEFELTRKSAAKIVRLAKERASNGVRMMADWFHKSVRPEKPEDGEAAAFYELELRDDGIYAVNLEWDPRAEKQVLAGRIRYISPAFDHLDDGRVTDLLNLALTNIPAMDEQRPLMAASAIGYEAAPVVNGEWDADAAVGRLRKWASSDGSGSKEKIDWRKYAKGFGYVGDDPKSFESYKLPHHDIRGGKFVTVKRGVIAAAGALQGARGGVQVPKGEIPAVRKHLAQHYHQWGAKAPWETEKKMHKLAAYMSEHEMSLEEMEEKTGLSKERLKAIMGGEQPQDGEHEKLAKGFGMKAEEIKGMCKAEGEEEEKPEKEEPEKEKLEGDDEEDEDEEKEEPEEKKKEALSKRSARTLLSALGAKTTAEAIGMIKGLQMAAKQTEDLVKRVAALEGKNTGDNKAKIIARLQANKQLAADMLPWAEKQSVETLEGFEKVTPRGYGATSRKVEGKEPAAQLSKFSKKLAKSMGLTEEELAKHQEVVAKRQADAREEADA